MSTELGMTGPSSGSLALRSDQQEWSSTQLAALAQLGVADAPAGDQAVFLHVCQRTGLDPFSKQIYMIGRVEKGKDGRPDTVKWTIQTGIDGFRVIAERHAQYAGQLEPEWCGPDGDWRNVWLDRQHPPVAARVGVLRHDWPQPVYATVHFDEFAAKYRDGGLMPMWRGKGAHMIGKVGEAHSLRKAFPMDLAGLYTDDEMAHVDHPGEQRVTRGVVLDVDGAPVGEARVTIPDLVGDGTAPAAGAPDARMRPDQQKDIFRLLRQVEIDDRWAWASDQLAREVRSWAVVTVADADRLITDLQQRAAQPDAAPDPTEQETQP
jgi:phage recombination protein Bet